MELKRRQPIGVELVKRGVVTEIDIQKALDYQREHPEMKLGDILHLLQLGEPNEVVNAIGQIMGVPGILLTSDTLKIKPTDYLPLETMKKNRCMPFEIENGKIKVCFSDVYNKAKMDSVKLLLLNRGLIMEPYITFDSDLQKLLAELDGEQIQNFARTNSNATIIELVDNIIKSGMEKRASDIHIEPLMNEIRVRYRIDGELFTANAIPKEKQQQLIGRLKAISNMHQEKQEAQDGRILTYDDYNIRVSSQPNVCGEKFVLRLLKKDDDIRNIFELGYPGTEEELRKSFDKRNSITIIAAPTGEGKTTTLYSVIDYLNSPEINITTIEDPVEIRIDGLNQIEIGNKTTFSGAL